MQQLPRALLPPLSQRSSRTYGCVTPGYQTAPANKESFCQRHADQWASSPSNPCKSENAALSTYQSSFFPVVRSCALLLLDDCLLTRNQNDATFALLASLLLD